MSDYLRDSGVTSGAGAIHTKASVVLETKIDKKTISWPVLSFSLSQRAFEHHALQLVFAPDVETMEGPGQLTILHEFLESVGKGIDVKIQPMDVYLDSDAILEWFGYITNVSLFNSGTVLNRLMIEAKSPTWLMDQGRKYRSFVKQRFSDLAELMMGERGIPGEIASTSSVYDHLFQWNQTDWEFLTSSYKNDGNWIYYNGSKVKMAKAASSDTKTLEWSKHVGSAEIKLNVTDFGFTTHCWDDVQKQAITGESSMSTSYSGVTKMAMAASKEKFGKKGAVNVAEHVYKADNAKSIADTKSGEHLARLVVCQIQSNVPSIKVGDTIAFSGLGVAFSGVYFVTDVTHNIEEKADYYNRLIAIPLEIANPELRSKPLQRIYDPVTALVTNIDESSEGSSPNIGRVKVKFFYGGDGFESHWVRVASPNAGAGRGFCYMPEVDDEVLVAFEQGDPNRPVVIGALWNGKDEQPMKSELVENGKVNNRVIFSRTGHKIVLCDKDGKESIQIVDKTGMNSMVIDSTDHTITLLADKDYVLTVKGNIKLKCDEDFTLDAKNIKLNAQESISLKSGTKGTDIKTDGKMALESKDELKADGLKIALTGKTGLDMSGGPKASLKGIMVEVQGSPIKLN